MLFKKKNTPDQNKKGISNAVLICGIIVLLFGSGFMVKQAAKITTSSAMNSFKNSTAKQRDETYQDFYQKSFTIAEEKYHVANQVTISVGDVREEAELEVLQVSDIEYVFREGNTKIWTSVKGHGTYTVDLSLAEFLVDQDRQYVLVRVPSPKLSTAGLDYEYENYLFEDGVFNGSTKEGFGLAREDLRKAQNQLQIKLASTQSYYESAQNSANEIIENLVKNFNPEATELVVAVDFVD